MLWIFLLFVSSAFAGYVDNGQISCTISPQISTGQILGNISGTTQLPYGITETALLDSVFGSAQGDMLYRNASSWTVLAPGSSGQVLQSGGSSGNPSWATISATVTATAPLSASGGNVSLTGNVPVTNGGTGLGSPTGLLYFNGGSTPTSESIVPVTQGGTGQNYLATGYVLANGSSAFSSTTTIPASVLSGNLSYTNGGTGLGSPTGILYFNGSSSPTSENIIPVSQGGTGQNSLSTGYVMANGSSAFSSASTIPTSVLSGNLSVANGGTGAGSPTGIPFFNGGSAATWYSYLPTSLLSGSIGLSNGGTGATYAFTQGSIVFAGASGVYTQDNSQLFWNDSTHRLGIGTASPAYSIDTSSNNIRAGGYYVGTYSSPGLIYDGTGTGSITLASGNGTIQTGNGQQINVLNSGGSTVVNLAGGAASYFNGYSVGIGNTSPSYLLDVTGSARHTHLVGGGSTPTLAAGTGAGTSPTLAIVGTDTAGKISVTTGTAPAASAVIVTMTFGTAFTSAPYCMVTPGNAATATLPSTANKVPYVSATATTTMTFTQGSAALTASTAYVWFYHCIQ